MKNFRKLQVWQRGIEITKMIYQFSEQLTDQEKFGLVSQMNRCAVSIPSNIAEGCSRSSDIELKRFIEIALGSAFELETQLIIAKEVYRLNTEKVMEELTIVQKMLNAYRSKIIATPNTNY
jgi:four helix bundle protein